MGSSCCKVKNRIQDGNSPRLSEASLEETMGGDKFSESHEVVKVPVDYPSKPKKPMSMSLRSIGSFRKGKIRKTSSLQSAVSVRLDPELEKLRKEYEQYRLTTQKELSEVKRESETLSSENKRLRGELKIFQATCTKLKNERDKAQMAEQDALSRSAAIESERDKIQRQFKLFRDTKANELQSLLKEKRRLETKLMKFVNVHEESERSSHEFLGEGGELIGEVRDMVATFDSESLLDANSSQLPTKGVEYGNSGNDSNDTPYTDIKKGDWNSAVQHLVKSLNASIMSIPENNVYRIYVAYTLDMEDEVHFFTKVQCAPLVQQCEFEGRFLVFIYLPSEGSEDWAEKDVLDNWETRLELINSSDIFVCFLGQEIGRFIEQEIQVGIQRKPGLKHSIFCVRGSEESLPTFGLDKELCSLINSAPRIKAEYFDDDNTSEEIANVACKNLKKIVTQFLVEQRDHNSANKIFPGEEEEWCVGCGWDIFGDYEQQQRLIYHAQEESRDIGLDRYFDQLNDHIAYDGPVQPLLITGDCGSGKSFLISRWIQMQERDLQGGLLIYHFVGSPTTFSADTVQVLRRLTVQLMQQSPSTCDPTRLEDEFPKWLDKISSRLPNGIILVIDGAENLENVEVSMKWLIDPLPVGARIIVLVGDGSYPREWRSWPTLDIQPLSHNETLEFIKSEWHSQHITLSPELLDRIFDSFHHDALGNPLFLTLLMNELSRSTSYQELSSQMVKFSKVKDLSNMYMLLIEEIIDEYGEDIPSKTLVHICLSRNGLSESELMQLFEFPWYDWTLVNKVLHEKRILHSIGGLFTFTNKMVNKAVMKYFNLQDQSPVVATGRDNLVQLYQKKNIPGQVTYRVADELPWLLVKMEQKEIVRQVICTMCIFVRLYRKGRCSELVNYWKYCDEDLSGMANAYYEFIKMMERDSRFSSRAPQLYDILGRFLRELGQLNLALKPLERSLELRESSMEPDHPSIGQSFHHLGGLYTQWKKFSTAETMYRQALEIKENAYGAEHPSVAKELEALAILYLMQDRPSLAEPLKKRASQIYQKYYKDQSSSSTIQILQKCVEQMNEIASSNISPEIGKSLNDLGVLFFIQNNNELAESFFKHSLEMRERLLGPEHPDVAQSLHNLAALYNDQKMFEDAESLYERAYIIRCKHFPAENPSVYSTTRQLAGLYRKQGKFESAEKFYRQILDVRERTLGPTHPSVAAAVNNLAVLLCQMDKHAQAVPLYERALKLYEAHLGIAHPRVSEILQNMAKLYLDVGDSKEAARLFKQALDPGRTSYHPPLRSPGSRRSSRDIGHDVKSRERSGSRRSSIDIDHDIKLRDHEGSIRSSREIDQEVKPRDYEGSRKSSRNNDYEVKPKEYEGSRRSSFSSLVRTPKK